MSRTRRSIRVRLGAVASVLIVALAAAASTGPARAQGYFGQNKVHYRTFDWHVYKAPHFDVYYYPDSEPFLEQVVSYAESAYLYLSRALDHEPKFRIPLIYYRTHAEFEQTNVSLYEIPESELAFAEPIEHRVVLPIDQPPDKLYAIMVHELTHIFEFSILFQDSLGRALRSGAPLWLMEGLAEHMARSDDSLSTMIIRDAVINGLVPPITKVQGLTFLTYRFGEAAFDFIEKEWGEEGIRTFLSEYRRILLSRDIEKAIKEAFGIEAEEFDRRFQKYLRQKYLPTLLEKQEPADYGKEIGFKLPGVYTFSPVLSPSGDLVAVLTNRYDYELDVVIINARTGEMVKNLTKGLTNDYEFITTKAFEGGSDLAWSPDGDSVAFFVRREAGWALRIKNALTGRLVNFIKVPTANSASPAFSPDGKKVVFSGNLDGQVDLFELDLATEQVRNLTDDEYYDSNPSWSPDGKSILYNRRVGGHVKVFLMDYEDPSRRTQITFGPTNELMPSFTRDGKSILYSSDAGKEKIYNLYSVDLESGEVKQYTDVMSGFFQAQDLPSDGGRERVVSTTYFNGRFRLFDVDITKAVKVETPEERAENLAEIKPFEPPLRLTVDNDEKKSKIQRTYHVEAAPTIGIGLASDGTVFGNATLLFSDLLGDRNFWVNVQTVADFQNLDLGYVNLSRRLRYQYHVYDFRDFLIVPTSSSTYSRVQADRFTGGDVGVSYPLNRYYRIQGTLGVMSRNALDSGLFTIDDPNTRKKDDFAFLNFNTLRSTNAVVGFDLVGDTVKYNPFGPWDGKRFRLGVDVSPLGSGSRDSTYTDYTLDYRAYQRVTKRSSIALRLGSYITQGGRSTLFGIGGYNQLRGYAFREFVGDQAAWMNLELRFPMVDQLRFPFGSIRYIRGFLFFDLGAAWTQDGYFFDREIADASFFRQFGEAGVFRDFKFWDSKEHTLRDGRGSYGIGFNFWMGILQLNWSFAKTLPYMQTDRASCQKALYDACGGRDPVFGCSSAVDTAELARILNTCTYEKVPESNWRSDFYIAYEF
ncbi:MAG TPA: hypothetical protein VNI57_03400 [Candidatus Saccharimonadales bacterium]|nr:hypothetical protein [Candidatus Saccharimonadales bacterium]